MKKEIISKSYFEKAELPKDAKEIGVIVKTPNGKLRIVQYDSEVLGSVYVSSTGLHFGLNEEVSFL